MQTCQVLIDSCNLTVDLRDISLNFFDISFNSIQFICYVIFQFTDRLCIFRDQIFQTSFATTDFFPQICNFFLCFFDVFLCSFDVFRISFDIGFQCIFYIFIQLLQRLSEVRICRLQCLNSILRSFNSICIFFHSTIFQVTQTTFNTINTSTEQF